MMAVLSVGGARQGSRALAPEGARSLAPFLRFPPNSRLTCERERGSYLANRVRGNPTPRARIEARLETFPVEQPLRKISTKMGPVL